VRKIKLSFKLSFRAHYNITSLYFSLLLLGVLISDDLTFD